MGRFIVDGSKRMGRARQGARRLQLENLEPRRLLSAASLAISEFMASNSTIADGDGLFSDWIEIHNTGTGAADLSGYFLTDSAQSLTRWAFPETILQPDEYLLVFASAPVDESGNEVEDYVDAGGYLHASFRISAGGEYLALTYEDPTTLDVSIVHAYAPEFPPQYSGISYGIASDSVLRYFDTPTPEAVNGAGLSGVVADTNFSVDRGFYDAPFQVEITTETAGAQIYYTTNGDAPTVAEGTLYIGPITISGTTTLRAAAFRDGYLPTNVDTQTYLFLDDIVQQDYQATLDMGFPSSWLSVPADYGFDPDVIGTFDANGNSLGGDIFDGVYAATIKDDLLSLPTISIVSEVENLFGPLGVLSFPLANQEYPASVEWIAPDGTPQFQVDAGLQPQGGAFRRHDLTRKHSMRLVFKGEYGASKLEFPLFGENAVDEFNTLVLRAGSNDGYSWSTARGRAQYIRDELGRSLQRDLGRPSPHGTFAHLYINGVYWGLYNPVERPDNEFAADYLGGNPENWDSIHVDETPAGDRDAWNAMLDLASSAGNSYEDFMLLQGKNPDGSDNPNVAPLLNVESYIDYLIINIWGGNWDWPFKNYWAGRNRDPETTTGFEFFNWDIEGIVDDPFSQLHDTTLNQNFSGQTNAGQAHQFLANNPEYRLLFADRVQMHMGQNGALSTDSLDSRYLELADQIESAMVAESARWGDMHFARPYTQADWLNQKENSLFFIANRWEAVLQELRTYGLFPPEYIETPVIGYNGEPVPAGYDLELFGGPGEVWYTLDGSDPRSVGGAVSPMAMRYTGTLIDIPESLTVKARGLQNGEWSALAVADVVTIPTGDVSRLRIIELHYHPADGEEYEFIELMNTDAEAISLDGVQIASFASEPYVFPTGLVLNGGERIVVARNPISFQALYGTEIYTSPTGYANANLSNGGETISLVGPSGQLFQHFTYGDSNEEGWPDQPDGEGPSLEYFGPFNQDPLDPNDIAGDPYDDPANWRASLVSGGTPGTGEPLQEDSADFDGDRQISGWDFLIWQRNYRVAGGATRSEGDADNNGTVDSLDLALWEEQYAVLTQPAPNADFDDDGESSGLDFLAWQRNFPITSGANFDQGDADHNGTVDAVDLSIWEAQYGTAPPLVAAVAASEDPAVIAASSQPVVADSQFAALAAVQVGFGASAPASRDAVLEEASVDEIFLEATVGTPTDTTVTSTTPQDEALAAGFGEEGDEDADDLFAPLEEELV